MPKTLVENLIYNPGRFSFSKAFDVAFATCKPNYVYIKSNINYSSKYVDISNVDGLKDGVAEVHVNISGIAGICGILPDEYTEDFLNCSKKTRQVLSDLFDIFNERIMLQRYAFLKRLNTETLSNPIEKSLIGNIIFSLAGFDFFPKSMSVKLPEQFKISAQNLLWRNTRSSSGLKVILESFFNIPVEIKQFTGGFVQLDCGEQIMIGRNGVFNNLGKNSFLGNKVWDSMKCITLNIGPLKLEEYEKFLPKHSKKDQKFSALQKMKEIIRLYIPSGVDVNIHFFLGKCYVNSTALNGIKRLNKDAFISGRNSIEQACFDERI